MKMTRKDKPVHTVPDGVWESSRTDLPDNRTDGPHLREIVRDAQGNGYAAPPEAEADDSPSEEKR